jgi:tetratricopeptide (TPR) repeat protein
MPPERWGRLRAVIEELKDSTPADRARRLQDAAASDPLLNAEIEDFLRSGGSDPEILVNFPTQWLFPDTNTLHQDLVDAAPLRWSAGTLVGRYRVERLLGSGGMGEVYAATDDELHRPVALKCVFPWRGYEARARDRMMAEARAAGRLGHPNIATVYDVLQHEGRVVIVMEFVAGNSLRTRLAEGRIPREDAIAYAMQLADALQSAHETGIVHCDLKPGNVQFTPGGVPKLLDFGIARRLPKASVETIGLKAVDAGRRFGTPGYMAPEQVYASPVDVRTDVYGLGILLFEMLAGRRPLRGLDPLQASYEMANGLVPDVREIDATVPAPIANVVAKALRKDPAERYQSAAEFRDALRQASLPEPAPEPEPVVVVAPPPSRRPRWTSWSAASVLVALVAGMLWYLGRPIVLKAAPAAERWYQNGVHALQEGAPHQAELALERAVAIDPQFALAWARLGEARLELDESEEAQQAVIKASNLVPDRTRLVEEDRLRLEGIGAMFERNHPAAIAAFSALAQRAPSDPTRFVDQGRAYEANNDVPRAIAAYEKAVATDPEYAAAHLRLAVLLARRDDVGQEDQKKAFALLDRAERLYEAASRREGVALVDYERGVIYNRMQRHAEARAALSRAVQIAEELKNAYRQSAALFKLSTAAGLEGKYEEADAYAVQALRAGEGLNPLLAEGLVDYGLLFVRKHDHAQAFRQFERALALAKRAGARRAEAGALVNMGGLEIAIGKTQSGTARVNQGLAFYERGSYRRELARGRTALAQALWLSGEVALAEQEYRKLIAVATTHGDAAEVAINESNLSQLLLSAERYPEALEHCSRSLSAYEELKLPFRIAYAALRRAEILGRLGRSQEAREQLGRLVTRELAGGERALAVERMTALRRASVALREDRLQEVISIAGPAVSDGGGRIDIRLQLRMVLALALARSGQSNRALAVVDAALREVRTVTDPMLESWLTLTRAEVLVVERRFKDSLATVTPLLSQFAARRQFESAWLAHTIAGAASRGLTQDRLAAQHDGAASGAFQNLEHRFTPDDWRTFQTRGDIVRIRREYAQ